MNHRFVFKCEVNADDRERIETCLLEVIEDMWNESEYECGHQYDLYAYGNYHVRWSLEDISTEAGEEE